MHDIPHKPFDPGTLGLASYQLLVHLIVALHEKGVLTQPEANSVFADAIKGMEEAGNPHVEEIDRLYRSSFSAIHAG